MFFMKWLILILLPTFSVKAFAGSISPKCKDTFMQTRNEDISMRPLATSPIDKFHNNPNLMQRSRDIGIEVNERGKLSIPFDSKHFPDNNLSVLDKSIDVVIELYRLGFKLNLSYDIYKQFHIVLRLAEKGFILPKGIEYPAERQDFTDRLRKLGYTSTD